MSALSAGEIAPGFVLPLLNGGKFSLQESLNDGPVVLAFFKISCPVCQYAAPFLERLQAYKGTNVTVLGVSQNDATGTKQFTQQFGVTFPVALDEQWKYPVSNAYGLTNVPTLFYVGQDGKIVHSVVGWSRDDMEAIAREAADSVKIGPSSLFKPGEEVAQFRAG